MHSKPGGKEGWGVAVWAPSSPQLHPGKSESGSHLPPGMGQGAGPVSSAWQALRLRRGPSHHSAALSPVTTVLSNVAAGALEEGEASDRVHFGVALGRR